LCLTLALPNLFLLDMAADNTLTFTNISLAGVNMDSSAFTVTSVAAIKIGSSVLSQSEWAGGGGGGSSRPSTGFLYPRGQG
jgi:hypothetical protein